MAITDKKTGVWGLDQTYNKINQGSIWDYIPQGLFSWGYGNTGMTGRNTTSPSDSPIQIPGNWGTNVKIYPGSQGNQEYYNVHAIKTDGTLWAWGRNTNGQLGDNSDTNRSSPVQIPGTTWSIVAKGAGNTGALKTDGTLWMWGYSSEGRFGMHSPVAVNSVISSPVQLASDTTWNNVAASFDAFIATKTDGTLWAWGQGVKGQNGAGNTTDYSSPIQIPGSTWTGDIAKGWRCSYGIKSDGTLWGWGNNERGNLGQNDLTDYSSPRQIPGTTWSNIAMNGKSQVVLATKTDGTLWAWGWNAYGALGQNSGDGSGTGGNGFSSPVQIPGTTWTDPFCGSPNSSARKTDGTAWAWGANQYGQLGPGLTAYVSSPIQIPGNWNQFRVTLEGGAFGGKEG